MAAASTTSGSTRSSSRSSPGTAPPTPGLSLQNDIVGPYFVNLANEEQQERWLPGYITGELIGAVAMTEPGAGSDLAGIKTSAVRDGDDWILNGSKTFISAGINSDLVVVVARTNPDAGHKGFSLLVVERGMEGFTRGRKLDKMGQHFADTAELNFENVRVPGREPAWRGGQGLLPPDDEPAVRAAVDRDRRRSPVPARRSPTRCSTSRTARPLGSRSAASSTTGS